LMMENVQKLLEQNVDFELTWIELEHTEGTTSIRMRVTSDAVKYEGQRIPVTAREHQMLADRLDGYLLTPKLCDLTHTRADIRIDFVGMSPQNALWHVADASAEREWEIDRRVEAELMSLAASGQRLQAGREYPLISNTCLNWVISNDLGRGGAERVIRHGGYDFNVESGPHWAEDAEHTDIEESLLHGARLVHREIQVSERVQTGMRWRPMELSTALRHPSYAPLLHYGTRHLQYVRVLSVPPPE